MAKIYAPNKEYTGISAGVPFMNGVGETDRPELLAWFREHGYTVEELAEETMPVEEPETDSEPEPIREDLPQEETAAAPKESKRMKKE